MKYHFFIIFLYLISESTIFILLFQLDDDQVPSETMVIKWVQDHVTNDDLKRIQIMREIRKCFARLSASGMYFR